MKRLKKLILVAPVLLMVVALSLMHSFGLVSDSAVEKVFSKFEGI